MLVKGVDGHYIIDLEARWGLVLTELGPILSQFSSETTLLNKVHISMIEKAPIQKNLGC